MNDLKARIIQCSAKPVEFTSKELGVVYLRRLTLGELDEMQAANRAAEAAAVTASAKGAAAEPVKPKVPQTARLLSHFIGDAEGVRMFSLDNDADVTALLNIPLPIAAELLAEGNRINALAQEGDAGNA
jgi:hypothetical protein